MIGVGDRSVNGHLVPHAHNIRRPRPVTSRPPQRVARDMPGRAEASDVLAKESELRAIDSPAAWASPLRSDLSVIDPFGLAAVGPSRVPRSMTSGSGVVRYRGLLEDASSRERSSRGYFLDLHAACARLGGKHVRNRAEHDDRKDAYCSVDQDDRRRVTVAGLEDARQDADHASFYQPKPARREGDCSQEGADEGHEHGTRHPQLDIGEAKGQNDEVESQRFGHPDNSGQKAQQWHTAQSDRPKDPFLEAVVEDDDSIWQWKEGDDSAPEVAHDDEGQDQNDYDANAKGEDDLDRLGQVIEVAAEAPVAGQEAEGRDGDQVQDPLHEDCTQRLRGRDRAVELEQVGAV